MIKRISKYILILVLFSNVCLSQNAFSDALLLEKNSESYLNKINLILTPKLLDKITNKPFTARQEYYLRNLKLFLEDPWNKEIKGLDLRIFLEISKIIDGYLELSQDLKLKLFENEANLTGLKKVLGEKEAEYKNIDSTDTSKTKDRENLKTGIANLAKDTSEIIIEIKQLINDTTELSTILKNKTSIDEYNEFKSVLDKTNSTVSPLGEDNEKLVKETSKESHFSISQSAIIDAIGNSIIEQVREDAVNFLFKNVLDKKFAIKNTDECIDCDDDETPNSDCTSLETELKVFFPRTITLVRGIKEQNANEIYTSINSTLRNSFNDDLKNMLDNLTDENNITKSKVFDKFLTTKEYSYFKFGVVLSRQLKDGFHPAEMFPLISDWVSKQSKNEKNKKSKIWTELNKYFTLTNLLQKNLRDVTDNSKNIWISITQLDELKKNETDDKAKFTSSAEFFLALLYQSDKVNFEFIRKKFFEESGNKFNDTAFVNFKDDLKSFVTLLRTTEQNTNTLINKSDKNINDYEAYLDNIDSTLSNTNSLLGRYFVDDTTVNNIQQKLDSIHTYRTHAFDIYKSITNRTYSKILPVVLKMFETQINEIADSVSFKKELIRYTTLYVDITNAKTQDELNTAIYKSVHNSGGYLRKMSEEFTISVNSYPGFFIGHEKINSGPFIMTPGFTVPVGVNIQIAHHYGLFFQVLDIGAAVNYRIKSDGTTNLPEDVTIKQVFSPGVFFSLNIFENFPLTFNLGIYVTPSLRKIDSSGLTLGKSKSVRLGLNISYDVPLWYIY